MGGSTTTNTTNNTTSEQKSAPDEQALAAYRSWLPVFQSTAQTPWNPATAQQIAGFTPQQQAAFQGIGNMQGMYQPYFDWASENTAAGSAGTAALMDPYMQQAAAYNAQGAQGTAGILSPYFNTAQNYMQGSAAGTSQALDPWLTAGTQNYAGQLSPWLAQGSANTTGDLTPWLAQGSQNFAGRLDPWLAQGTSDTTLALNPWLKSSSGNIDIGAQAQAGALSPWLSQASSLTGQAAGPISSASIGNYLSPYQSDVIDATMAQINAANQQQQTQLAGNATVAGALGGNRIGVAQGTLGGQQALNTASTLAGLNQQNYAQALSAAQQDAARGLQAGSQFAQYGSIVESAQQADAARRLQAAQQYAGLGAEQQQAMQNYAARQLQGGQMQQAALSDYAARQLQSGQMQQQAEQNYAARQLQAGQMQQAALADYANRQLQAGTAQQQAMQADQARMYQAGAGIAGMGTTMQQATAQDYARAMQAGQNIYGYGSGYAQQVSQDYARRLAAAQQMAALGTGAQANALQGYQAQIQAGTMQQQQAQNMYNAAQQNAVAQTMWDYQNQQWLAAMLGQSVPLMGGTVSGTSSGTSTSTQQQNPGVGSYIGMGLGLMSMLSDERAKENIEPIGKSYDGQPIYKYNYKGHHQTQIGMMAQDVEKRHPEAVQEDGGGTKYVNYDLATHDAADRGHFARGGRAFSSYESYFPWAELESPRSSIPSFDMRTPQTSSASSSTASPDAMSSYKSMKDQAELGKGLGKTLGDLFKSDNGWGASYDTTGGTLGSNFSASMSNLGDALGGMFGFADGGDTEKHVSTPKLEGSQYVTPGASIANDDYYKAANDALASSSQRHPSGAPAPIPWGADPNNPANQAATASGMQGNPIADFAGGLISLSGGLAGGSGFSPYNGQYGGGSSAGAFGQSRKYDPSVVDSLPVSYRAAALAQLRANGQIAEPTSTGPGGWTSGWNYGETPPSTGYIPHNATPYMRHLTQTNSPGITPLMPESGSVRPVFGQYGSSPMVSPMMSPTSSPTGGVGQNLQLPSVQAPSLQTPSIKSPALQNIRPLNSFPSAQNGLAFPEGGFQPIVWPAPYNPWGNNFADGGEIAEFGFPETWEKYKPYETELAPGDWYTAAADMPGKGEVTVGYPTGWFGGPVSATIPSPMEGRSLSNEEAFGYPHPLSGGILPGVATKSERPTLMPPRHEEARGEEKPKSVEVKGEGGLGVLAQTSPAALMTLTADSPVGAETVQRRPQDTPVAKEPAKQPSKGDDVVNSLVEELRAQGASDSAIRGILANVKDESGFNPTSRHPDQPKFGGEAHYAHGLFQEGGTEWLKYESWLNKNYPGEDWRNPRLQARFLAINMKDSYKNSWEKMNSGSPEEAAQTFLTKYLRPAARYRDARNEKYSRGVPDIDAYLGQGVGKWPAPEGERQPQKGLGILAAQPTAGPVSQPMMGPAPQRERGTGILSGLGIDFNPLNLSDSQRERLMYLGMGMAGNAMNPMAGGMEGLKTYAGIQQSDRQAQFEGMRLAMEAQKMTMMMATPQVIGKEYGPYGVGMDIYGTYDPATGKYKRAADQTSAATGVGGGGPSKTDTMFPGYNLIGSNVHGDDLLKGLSPAQASRIKGMANHDIAPPQGKLAESPQGQHEIALAQQYRPGYNPADFQSIQKLRTDWLAGKTKDNLQAANNLIKNLHQLAGIADSLKNTNYPAYNSIVNWAREQSGDPRAGDFVTVNNKVAEEAVRLARGSGGAEADVKRELENLKDVKSPPQMKAIINRLTMLAEDRISSLSQQRDEAFPLDGEKRYPILTQDSKNKIEEVRQWSQGTKPLKESKPSGEVAKPKTEEEYNALPIGTPFKDPTGAIRIKQ